MHICSLQCNSFRQLFRDVSLTAVKFPDISRFSRQVVTLTTRPSSTHLLARIGLVANKTRITGDEPVTDDTCTHTLTSMWSQVTNQSLTTPANIPWRACDHRWRTSHSQHLQIYLDEHVITGDELATHNTCKYTSDEPVTDDTCTHTLTSMWSQVTN